MQIYKEKNKNLPAIFVQKTAATAAAASRWQGESFTLANSHMYNMYNVYIVHNLHLVLHMCGSGVAVQWCAHHMQGRQNYDKQQDQHDCAVMKTQHARPL